MNTHSISSLEVHDVSVGCKPQMMNFRSGEERLDHFTYRFLPGRTYGIVCGPGCGGWALSYLLSGLAANFEGTVTINSKIVLPKELQINGWYVGQGLPAAGKFLKKEMTVRRQLECGTSNQYKMEELVNRFELSASRLDRELRYVSNERWNASTAIGLMHEKQVFCFPWLDEVWVEAIRKRLEYCSAALNDYGCITILPVQSLLQIEHIADEVIVIT
jgi:ABC-type multidrug transport system ATPase subunit